MTRLLNFLELKRGEERGVFYVSCNERYGVLYSSGGGNMNGMSFNKSWQRIMNLDLILALGEIRCIKCGDWWEWGAHKVRFSSSYCKSLYSQFQKIILYSILIGIVSFLYSNWSPGYLVSRKLTSFIDSKYSEIYQWNGEQMLFVRKQFQYN